MLRVFLSLLLSLYLTSCATSIVKDDAAQQKNIPDISNFHGSLLVFSPKHRFQVLIQWQADLQHGQARLTHAATGSVVELRWLGQSLSMRNNQSADNHWKVIQVKQLQALGIVLPPWVLAKVLHRQIPPSLHPQGDDVWQGKINDSVIQLRWQNNYHRLTMTDITRGRKAILRMDGCNDI